MAGQHPLFSIPELVELILSVLPFHDLLTAARVCSLWRSLAYEHSHHLKQTLFLVPPPTSATEYLVHKHAPPLSDSATLFYRPVPCVVGGSLLAEWQGIKLTTIATINPFLQNDISYTESGSGSHRIRFRPSRWKLRKLLRLQNDTEETSIIRRMHVTQPPCTKLSITNADTTCLHPACRSYGVKSEPFVVNNGRELTIGALVDALYELVQYEDGDEALMCEHEKSWFGGKAESATFGMGLRIFEASSIRQAVTVEGFVDEGSDDVVRARRFGRVNVAGGGK